MTPSDNVANIGPITLRLTPEALEMIGNEWSRRGKSLAVDEVVSAMLNEVADPEEDESEEERVDGIIAALRENAGEFPMNHEQIQKWIAAALTDLNAAQSSQDRSEIIEHLHDAQASIDRAIDYTGEEEGN